jgi:hypothetical protein
MGAAFHVPVSTTNSDEYIQEVASQIYSFRLWVMTKRTFTQKESKRFSLQMKSFRNQLNICLRIINQNKPTYVKNRNLLVDLFQELDKLSIYMRNCYIVDMNSVKVNTNSLSEPLLETIHETE